MNFKRPLDGGFPALLAGLFLLGTLTALAHETDNFSLPLDHDLADLGVYLATVHTVALQETLAEVNAGIEKALLIRDEPLRAARLKEFHAPRTLSTRFTARFGHPMFEDGQLEQAIEGSWGRKAFPGQITSHQDLWMNFSAYFLLDPRRFMIPSQSRTVKAFGVYFGTDKLVHFHRLGEDYFEMYESLRGHGVGDKEARELMLEHFVKTGLLSEEGLFGTITTGVFSNADLAANYAGFLFRLNLTEPVRVKGEEREPIFLRSGVFWRLNRNVRPRSGWLAAFISDHWNEALNPNLYNASMRPGIRRVLKSRAENIVRFYTEKDDRPATAEYFNNLARELSTYYGEPYGHSDKFELLMTIGNTCLPVTQNK